MSLNPVIPVEYAVLLGAVVLAASAFLAWRSSARCRRNVRALLAALRMLGVGGLLAVALNPGQWRDRTEEKQRQWAVLADRSLSMATADAAGRARWAEAARLAARARSLSRAPDEVLVMTFAEGVEDADAERLAALAPDGRTTDALGAVKALLNRFRSGSRALTGILLLSDGRQVEPGRPEDAGLAARARDVPVYAVALGGDVAGRDLRLSVARRQVVAFEGQKTRVAATLENHGLGNVTPTVRLLDGSGRTVSEQRLNLASGAAVPVQFETAAGSRGYQEFAVRADPWEGEDSPANNEARVGMVVLGNRMRLFLAEGTPCWDTKFLIQLMRKQPTLEVTAVYRLTADRFFRVETDVSAVAESSEAIFPDAPADLASYDAVLIGKGAEYFLTPARIRLLQDFVQHQGGCLFFCRGKPYSGAFPELESMEPVAWGDPVQESFRFRPTREGEDVGLFGGLLAGIADPAWQKLPPLRQGNWCDQLKPFAQVLVEGALEGGDRTRTIPLLVTRRYGKGLVAVVNAGGLWQWDFFPSAKEIGSLYQEVWAQCLQWAATYAEFLPGQPYALHMGETSVLPEAAAHGRVLQRSGAGAAAEVPAVRVRRGETVVQELAPSGTDGEWAFVFTASEPGTYCLELVNPHGGAALGPRATVQVRPRPSERDTLSADPAFLRALAETSGGRLVAEADLEQVVRELEPKAKPADLSKAVWVPVWDRAWALVAVLACFAAEWFVRRRQGLL